MQTFTSGNRTIRLAAVVPPGKGPFPALLMLHGAGGHVSWWLDGIGTKLAQIGLACFAPHYFDSTGTERADPETILDGRHFPVWLETARDAITYIATQPEIDPRRIAVLGISLGAYLAMALAVEESRVAAVVELSGGVPDGWSARIHRGMPPVLAIHGEEDRVVPVSEARALNESMRASGAHCEMHILPGQGHWFGGAAQRDILLAIARFLSTRLGLAAGERDR